MISTAECVPGAVTVDISTTREHDSQYTLSKRTLPPQIANITNICHEQLGSILNSFIQTKKKENFVLRAWWVHFPTYVTCLSSRFTSIQVRFYSGQVQSCQPRFSVMSHLSCLTSHVSHPSLHFSHRLVFITQVNTAPADLVFFFFFAAKKTLWLCSLINLLFFIQ